VLISIFVICLIYDLNLSQEGILKRFSSVTVLALLDRHVFLSVLLIFGTVYCLPFDVDFSSLPVLNVLSI